MSKNKKTNKADNFSLPTLYCPNNLLYCQLQKGLTIKLNCPTNVEITLQ